MTTTQNLQKTMEYYDANDVPFSGNPQITYFCDVNNTLQMRRHTNFSYGMININKQCETTINNQYITTFSLNSPDFDVLNSIIICVNNLNDLNCVQIYFDDVKLELSLEYIKTYNQITKQIIYHTNTHTIIAIPTNPDDFFYITGTSVLFTYLPNIRTLNNLKVNVITTIENLDIQVMVKCSIVDSEERKNIKFNYNEIYPLPLTIKPNSEGIFDLSFSNYAIRNNILGVKIKNFEKLDYIQLNFENSIIQLGRNVLEILVASKLFKWTC